MSTPAPAVHDPAFPVLHIRPAAGWLNDPNGVSRFDGRYHVFFQYNPYGPNHGNVHWGHASSTDLLHWQDEPVALRPTPGGIDATGCWSGCVVDDDGVPTAVYTGVRTHAWDSGVILARGDRTLRTWVQDDHWQVQIPDHPEITEVRDPYVFTLDGHRYAIQGAGSPDGPPRVLLYGCDDLTAWEPLGDFLTIDDEVAAGIAPAQIWECPNLVRIDDTWVLLVSLWRHVAGTYQLSGVSWLTGDLVDDAGVPRFAARNGGLLDAGPCFYAPQVLVADDRALLWGWAWEDPSRDQALTDAAGWAGVLTFPREVIIRDGAVTTVPAAELTGLRGEPLAVSAEGVLPAALAFEIESDGPVELRLIDDGLIDDGTETVVAVSDGPARLLVDGSVIEVFGPGLTQTVRAYPTASSHWALRTDDAFRVWALGL